MVRLAVLLFTGLVMGLPLESRCGTLSDEEIIARSFSTDCLEWKITGACIWLRCSIFGCRIVTSPRISHRLPDFVVAAYPEPGQSPWQSRALNKSKILSKSKLLEGGSITGIGASRLLRDELKFHEVDVIGSPVTRLSDTGRFLCRSVTKPFAQYFVSLHDAYAWRTGVPDAYQPESLQPGIREIGSWPEFTWGPVYPRSGFVIQLHAGKAAAVASQRAIDVVLRDSSGHKTGNIKMNKEQQVVRGNLKVTSPKACHKSGGRWQRTPRLNEDGHCVRQTWHQWLPEANEKTDRWQMLLPHHSNQCETFGEKSEWLHPGIAEDERYLWNYWAKYKCCVKRGGVLLKAFDF